MTPVPARNRDVAGPPERAARIYRERRETLLAAIDRHLADDLRVLPAAAGLHVSAAFARRGIDADLLAARQRRRGRAPGRLLPGPGARGGLAIGYGAIPAARIDEGIRRLASCLRASRPGAAGARVPAYSAAMTRSDSVPSPAVTAFRALHRSGCFVMPNPWDAGSAVFLAHLGFKALATTSAGFAFGRGLPDAVGAVPCELAIAHVREVVAATPLPVNADFQDGYAREPERVARHVADCLETGAAGLSIEDATGDPASPLHERGLAVERVRAARAAIDATGSQAVLTARCEAYLVDDPDPARTALDRLAAFAEAGADCLFAPGVRHPSAIAEMVRAVAPRPLNVLVSTPAPDPLLSGVARLAELGVRRISVGSALARVAWAAFARAARALADTGSFDALADAMPFAELDALFAGRR